VYFKNAEDIFDEFVACKSFFYHIGIGSDQTTYVFIVHTSVLVQKVYLNSYTLEYD
jgi:hypothetical protein